jgi:hypothetical protein
VPADFPITEFQVGGSTRAGGWARFGIVTDAVETGGTHHTMLDPPHVPALAGAVSAMIGSSVES